MNPLKRHTASHLGLTCLILALAAPAGAALQTREIDYQDGDTPLRGYLAWDDAIQGKRPGIIVVHEWWGLNDYVRRRARMLAELGYVAFAVDMYGEGKATEHPSQAGEWAKQISQNVEAWQQRALRGVEILRSQDQVDGSRLAAIGYCFGGATVLQMAYSGADLDGVVSFHGSLPVATEQQQQAIEASILAAHGAEDGFIPAERVQAFQQALDQADADWQMIVYGNARHGFTNPKADEFGMDNVRYDPQADRRSWRDMQQFLNEIFPDG